MANLEAGSKGRPREKFREGGGLQRLKYKNQLKRKKISLKLVYICILQAFKNIFIFLDNLLRFVLSLTKGSTLSSSFFLSSFSSSFFSLLLPLSLLPSFLLSLSPLLPPSAPRH